MKLHRTILGLVLLVSLVLLAACGAPADGGMAGEAATDAEEAAPADDEVVEIEEADEEAMELSGEIVISIASNDVQTYQAIADAYMEMHPNVDVLVELKPPGVDAYLQWIRSQFTSEVPRVSLIESPHLREFAQEGRLVDWGPYLNKENPYTGEKWEDSFEEWGLNLVRDPNTGQMFTMPYQSVQTFWIYNKDHFEQAGITDVPPRPTWDQFVEWNEKLRDAGIIPIAIEGTTEQIWGGGRMPWLMRSAMDQYHRDDLQIIQCQEGDWCFREGIDDVWTYDPTDVRNDDPDRVSVNIARHLAALRNGEINFNNECTVEMMTQVGRVFKTANGFVPEGWTGMTDAYPLFLTQRAAMRMVHGGIYTSLPKDIRSLAQGEYGGQAEVTAEDSAAAVEFEYGRFAFPTIEGPCVQGTARANELTSGYLALPLKDRAQNDLEVDFVMFWTSPQGMRIFLENKLDTENLQGGIAGPPLIKNVTLPGKWEDIFAQSVFIGNYEKPGAPGDAVARGFFKYEETKREWSIMVQEFFEGKMTAEEFADRYQTLLEDNFDGMLEFLNLTHEDLDNPEKRPPGWVAAGPY
ncbi:MAG: ABC transporter substrate-binding protein [Caldilineaceae bacterium]|nr:ABC transporter substrate-binding protein [Caldilineaceae bacterium]MDE0462056.1 ABC transporter substrate-binding protein [Caldilineaceae bacterium]